MRPVKYWWRMFLASIPCFTWRRVCIHWMKGYDEGYAIAKLEIGIERDRRGRFKRVSKS